MKVSALHAVKPVSLEVEAMSSIVWSRCGRQPVRGRSIQLWVDEVIKAIRITEADYQGLGNRGRGDDIGFKMSDEKVLEVCFMTMWVKPHPSQ